MDNKRIWSASMAFQEEIATSEALEDDIQEWMEESGTSYDYARERTIDAIWEEWDSSSSLDGWIEDISRSDEEYDTLTSQANVLLTENMFRTLVFDPELGELY